MIIFTVFPPAYQFFSFIQGENTFKKQKEAAIEEQSSINPLDSNSLQHEFISQIIQFMQEKTGFSINRSLFIKSRKEKILNFYDFDPKQLGRGAYGVVYRAKMKNKQNTWRAVKKIPKSAIKNPQQFINEIDILKSLDHPSIIKLYETFEDDRNVFLVTDLCDGGELFDRLQDQGNFTEEDARIIFRQIAEGVNLCHTRNIAHRDLKPENFLFLNKKSMNLKLIDFGLSFNYKENMREELKAKKETKLVGTSYYIAPEVIKGDYDQRCDIWSMGVILYILVTAVPPFDGDNDKEIIEAVRKGEYTFDIPEMVNVSPQLKDFIKKILISDGKRLTMPQIFDHPWMTSKLKSEPLKLNFSKLSNFSKFSKLKTLAVTYIASQLPEKDIEKLGSLFKQIDSNHDGYLTVDQITSALDKQKDKASLQELKQIMEYLKTDKSGRINYTEFIASCLDNSVIYKEENIMGVFRMLDKDGNGVVEADQLRQALEQKNIGVDPKIVQEIIKNCDKNGDGMIDYKEFLSSISQINL